MSNSEKTKLNDKPNEISHISNSMPHPELLDFQSKTNSSDSINQLFSEHLKSDVPFFSFPPINSGESINKVHVERIDPNSPALNIPLIQPAATRKGGSIVLSSRGEPIYVDVTPFLLMPQHKVIFFLIED